ncbi:MAG: DUF952 domain-containing protein [Caulobacterales bacterium]|nr:DUF952 domain-containing protein [Caulobacterales bacterium]
MVNFAYKIEDKDVFEAAMDNGFYTGSALDNKDGFIHLSTKEQSAQTLKLYFSGVPNLILAKINLEPIINTVKWEASRNGDLFPHIYADLPKSAVSNIYTLKYDGAGNPILPIDLE